MCEPEVIAKEAVRAGKAARSCEQTAYAILDELLLANQTKLPKARLLMASVCKQVALETYEVAGRMQLQATYLRNQGLAYRKYERIAQRTKEYARKAEVAAEYGRDLSGYCPKGAPWLVR